MYSNWPESSIPGVSVKKGADMKVENMSGVQEKRSPDVRFSLEMWRILSLWKTIPLQIKER